MNLLARSREVVVVISIAHTHTRTLVGLDTARKNTARSMHPVTPRHAGRTQLKRTHLGNQETAARNISASEVRHYCVLNRTQLALVLCFRNFRLLPCVIKQTTV